METNIKQKFYAIRILLIILAGFCASPSLAGQSLQKAQQVSLPGTETLSIPSADIGQHYQIHIALPSGYSVPGRSYPVLYLLDSDIHFGFVKSVTEALHLSGVLPETILVGIGYGEVSLAQWSQNRDRDFLVAPKPGPMPGTSGNATRFLGFLRNELLPKIEASYRVKAGDRTLLGMSAGAIFAAHVLAVAPELFQQYIIVSPYLVAGQEIIIGQEAVSAKTRKDLKARVYTALGEAEQTVAGPGWNAFCENLQQRKYPGLTLHQEVLQGLTHFEMPYVAYLNGLKDVLGRRFTPLKAAAEQYPAMAGSYFLSLAGFPILVKAEKGSLWAYFGPNPAELVPISATHFTAQGIPGMEFAFLPGTDGQAEVLLITQLGFAVAAWKMP